MKQLSAHQCFGGRQLRYTHHAQSLDCEMTFSIYLPAKATQTRVPVLYWLSGLTCTDENFVIKAGAQQYADEFGVAIVAPDTSPRGAGIPDDPQASDLGMGAGFYLDATESPWNRHYKMYSYIVDELPRLIKDAFPVDADRQGIFGHSMGGHGALTIYLKNPTKYQAVSAFAPIVAPMQCPWGIKAFSHYLGSNQEIWKQYDATVLLGQMDNASNRPEILIDQGTADPFLSEQLKPALLAAVAKEKQYPLTLRMQEGYDHSYFFIATFMRDHIRHHADCLK